MPSKIQVDQIAGASGNTVTVPSGQTLDISSATLSLPSTIVTTTGTQTLTNKTIGVSQLTGTLGVANGGTGLTSLGTAGQVIKVNSGATGLEFGTASSGKVVGFAYSNNIDTTWINSTSPTSTGLTVSYTPVDYVNNSIIVQCFGNVNQDDGNTAYLYFKIGGTGNHTINLTGDQFIALDLDYGRNFATIATSMKDTSFSANASETYTLYGWADNSSSDFRPQSNLTLTVWEIKP